MPHSKNINVNVPLSSGVMRCSCGQMIEYKTERENKMKLQMHLKKCPDPPEGIDTYGVPRKHMTYEENLKHETAQYRKLYE